MNKTAIKNFAIWARVNLIDATKQRAYQYEITKDNITDAGADVVSGKPLSKEEKEQRRQLIDQVNRKGFDQVMEEVAYTWFNRFIALRFMEVNGYLPTKIRVFTDAEGNFKPEILKEALTIELPVDKSRVMELLEKQDNEELYKMLLIAQCNELSNGLPDMFEVISNYTELLFPNNLLKEDSILGEMVNSIPEEDWTDAVQIIGWLYQYYNSELKDETFALLKKNVKISKERIPAATQLFTPDWIVRYMVENSLGRLWYDGHPNEEIKKDWKYYLDEVQQEPDVEENLKTIREEYKSIKPEDIKVIDPCMGSGHILVYAFDVLMQIYTSAGWSERDAAESILENNLFGLDIDDRAGQLAYFAVMMKARKYNRKILTKNIKPKVYSIQESNNVKIEAWWRLGPEEDIARRLVQDFTDAKEYGSILCLSVTTAELQTLKERLEDIEEMSDQGNLLDVIQSDEITRQLYPLVELAEVMVQKYNIVITNPPYMGSGNMGGHLLSYIKENYPDSKTDLYSVFIECCLGYCKENGFQAMITQHSWMFLSRFEKLRVKIQDVDTINMAHLGPRAFEDIGGEVVQTVSFVKRKSCNTDYKGTYCRLIDGMSQTEKESLFLSAKGRYIACQNNFKQIFGSPVAYWISASMLKAFSGKELADYGKTRQGFATGDNDRFLRQWTEIDYSQLVKGCTSAEDFWSKNGKYAPCNKGGESRKWYGNNYIVCKFDKASYDALSSMGNHLPSREYYFKSGLTWSTLSSGFLSMRLSGPGYLFETKGSMYFADNEQDNLYLLGLMNSKVAMQALQVLCPTIDFHEGPVSHVPVIVDNKAEVERLVESNIQISKEDWDSFEISWDFKAHPFVGSASIEDGYLKWKEQCNKRFELMKQNDEELNRLFISMYQLQEEMNPSVDEKTITINHAELSKDVKSFISYAVGCMFGRYSLDKEGLVFAGGEWNPANYKRFQPDKDAIIPISSDEYFEDDIVGRFVSFVECLYGSESLESNLKFIAQALGGKGSARDVIREYFLNGFYSDHLKIYQKKPIYWLFSSGTKHGFKCLVYIHRYRTDTIARLRTDYIHEQQSRYRTAIDDLDNRINSMPSASERVRLNKDLQRLKDQADEIRLYEEKIHHLADQMIGIDLDNGIKKNYSLFEDVLEKI